MRSRRTERGLDVTELGLGAAQVGSDWPVSVLAGGYDRVWDGLVAFLDEPRWPNAPPCSAGPPPISIVLDSAAARPGTKGNAMRFARLGPVGAEFPVLQHEDVSYDLRTLTADIDGDFLADDGLGRAQASLAERSTSNGLEDVDGAARRRADRAPRQDRLHRPQLPRPRGGDRARRSRPSPSCS